MSADLCLYEVRDGVALITLNRPERNNGMNGDLEVGATGTVTVTIAPAPVAFVTPATLPQGKSRTAYSTTITVAGGTPGYTWARTSGSLAG